MTTTLLSPNASATNTRLDPALARSTQLGRWPCLILSANKEHQSTFAQAALARGWETFVTADPQEALKYMCRNSIKLALLDMPELSESSEQTRSLAEYIKWLGGVLLVINGPVQDSQATDSSVELWARQLGVWSYLPGVAPQGDLRDLCDQARQVVEKLHKPYR